MIFNFNSDATFIPSKGRTKYEGHLVVAIYFYLGNRSIYYELDEEGNMNMIPMVKNFETEHYIVSTGNNLYQWNITAKKDLVLYENDNTTGIEVTIGNTYSANTNYKLVTLK